MMAQEAGLVEGFRNPFTPTKAKFIFRVPVNVNKMLITDVGKIQYHTYHMVDNTSSGR